MLSEDKGKEEVSLIRVKLVTMTRSGEETGRKGIFAINGGRMTRTKKC